MRTILVLLILFSSTLAFGQGTLLQGSATTAGHVPMYVTQGTGQVVVIDAGGAGGGAAGVGLSELSLTARGAGTGQLGTNVCDYDAPITSATGFHFFCFSANVGGNALLAVGAGGGAPQLPVLFNINGTNYSFPTAIPSNIPQLTVGPAPSTSNQPFVSTQTVTGPPFDDPHHTFGVNNFNCNLFATDHAISCIKSLNFFGTSAFQGSIDGIHLETILQTATSASTADGSRIYTGATILASANVDDNGTAGTPRGMFYGLIGQAQNPAPAGMAGPGANYPRALVGLQGAPSTAATTAPFARIGVEGVDYGGAVQGTGYDIAFSASAAFSSSVGWNCAFCVSPSADRSFAYNYSPMNVDGILFGALSPGRTISEGIDISAYTFSAFEYKGPNFQITGAGAATLLNGGLTVGSASPASGTARNVTINGAAAGTSAGSLVAGQNGGAGAWGLGNFSAVLGGSFDNTTLLWSGPSSAVKIYTNNALAATISTAQTLTQVGGLLSISPSVGVGYATGAGGTITQITSRTTGVTLNKTTGAITLFSAAGSATPASFTLTSSAIAANDVVFVNQQSGTDKYEIFVTNVAAGSCQITFFTTGGTTTEQPVFNFTVMKGAAS